MNSFNLCCPSAICCTVCGKQFITNNKTPKFVKYFLNRLNRWMLFYNFVTLTAVYSSFLISFFSFIVLFLERQRGVVVTVRYWQLGVAPKLSCIQPIVAISEWAPIVNTCGSGEVISLPADFKILVLSCQIRPMEVQLCPNISAIHYKWSE